MSSRMRSSPELELLRVDEAGLHEIGGDSLVGILIGWELLEQIFTTSASSSGVPHGKLISCSANPQMQLSRKLYAWVAIAPETAHRKGLPRE